MWNLSLASLRKSYEAGEFAPRDLLPKLRAQAVEQKDYNARITLFTEAELMIICRCNHIDV